jgi:hypothetical protein
MELEIFTILEMNMMEVAPFIQWLDDREFVRNRNHGI